MAGLGSFYCFWGVSSKASMSLLFCFHANFWEFLQCWNGVSNPVKTKTIPTILLRFWFYFASFCSALYYILYFLAHQLMTNCWGGMKYRLLPFTTTSSPSFCTISNAATGTYCTTWRWEISNNVWLHFICLTFLRSCYSVQTTTYPRGLVRSPSLHFTTFTQIRSRRDKSCFPVWRSIGSPWGQTTFTHFGSLRDKKKRMHFNKTRPPRWKIEFIQFGSLHDASVRTFEWTSAPVWNLICSVWVLGSRNSRKSHRRSNKILFNSQVVGIWYSKLK